MHFVYMFMLYFYLPNYYNKALMLNLCMNLLLLAITISGGVNIFCCLISF